jgi:hypothetical protein
MKDLFYRIITAIARWITRREMAKLLADQGEVAFVVGKQRAA